jgi:ubiquinone/menaquinone biosynthesis C-methylase UbiE
MSSSYWDDYNQKIYDTRYSEVNMAHVFCYDYDREIVSLRFEILEKYCLGKRVADLGCGTGSYLIPLSKITKEIVGVDFSQEMLNTLQAKLESQPRNNIRIYRENIKNMSLGTGAFDVVYSVATLYHVPEVEKVILEMNRILRKGGIAVFELGNLWSLSTVVVRNYPTGVKSLHISLRRMQQIIRQAKFKVLEYKAFQLLPMLGGPIYMFPLVTNKWKIIMGKKINQRTLDEIVSSSFLFRYFAFRHLFVCQKEEEVQ